ncbi:hypothetical protein KFE25_006050 [Diacronema lutheri]|uniref:Acyltransferase n=1 Tax=Diacronema lutheri TaxID=2081491 RepID=A0A7R9UQL8_DIALT|nr:hypothetical protein KFE25_006050 [Diacronema lutheri]|mmetsp:Transcript_18471/g.57551  ORF Transcript_18471/g.57551 Transcript_18471/m.57551 type:complete len:342 (+) Transcript_18471:100-1125(+)
MRIADNSTPLTTTALQTKVGSATARPKVGIANVVAVWLWLGWIANYWFSVVLACALAWLRWRTALGCLVGFYALLFALPRDAGVQMFGSTIGRWIVRRAAEYFAMRVLFEDVHAIRDSGSPLIFALEPHDVLPVSMLAFHATLDWIPGHVCAGLMTSAVFRLPGMKSVYSMLSAHSVDRATFSRLLQRGTSVCFCPGGVQEVIHLERENEVVLFLNARLGFAKLALQHRTPAVPAFTFGLAGTYSHRFMRGPIAERIARTIGFLPGVFWGLGAIPFGPPRPRTLTTVIGKPLPLPAGLPADGSPPPEMVREYHGQFVVAMRALFETHKAAMGMSQVCLRII